jgi:hypothetical protein
MSASARLQIVITAVLFLVGMIHTAWPVPETTVTFSVDDVDFSQTDGYDVLNVAGCHLAGEPGQPLLPCKAVNFVIPRGQGVSQVRVEVESEEHLPGSYYIYPAQPDVPEYGQDDFVGPDVNVYGSSEPFPGVAVIEGKTTTAWGWKLCQVMVWPLEYIPADREVWLNESIKISLELLPSTENEQEILPRSKEQHEEWEAAIEQVVANPADVVPFGPSDFSGLLSSHRWVLILPAAGTDGREQWYDACAPLIQHRQNQGLDVEITYVDQITQQPGEAGVLTIRDYLKVQHQLHGARWACLVGDHEMIPWTYSNPGLDRNIPNDWVYCDLDGDWPGDADWAPELWVGRVPALSPSEGENFVEKALVYEQTPGYGNFAYLDTAFYEYADICQYESTCDQVAEHQDPDIQSVIWGELPSYNDPNPWFPDSSHILQELAATHYHYVSIHCHGVYDPPHDRPDKYACLTSGLYQYGVGLMSDIGPEEFAVMWNTGYYYFWYSISCYGAKLDFYDQSVRSRAEMATCVYDQRCAVAYAGNTRQGHQWASPPLQCCAWDLLFPQTPFVPRYFNHAGSVEAISKWRMYYVLGLDEWRDNFVRYSHNLFGDPATGIWAPQAEPGELRQLTAENTVGPLRIELSACDPNPAGSLVTIRFLLNRSAPGRIGVFDTGGRLVQSIHEGLLAAGVTAQRWDCSALAPGVYMIRLEADEQEVTKRVVLLR